jgi:hypothetical protein
MEETMTTPPSRPLKAYIAGPFTDHTAWGVEQNIRAAERLALHLAEAGHHPFCPHTQGRYYSGELPEQFWLDWGLAWLRACDVLVLVTNSYEYSRGTKAEVKLAEELKIPILRPLGEWDVRGLRSALGDPVG